MDTKEELWKQVQEFYKEKFNIEPEMIELATNLDILKMCASGASNQNIAYFLQVDDEVVKYIIDKYLGFTGWQDDLEVNPLSIYKGFEEPFDEGDFMEHVIANGYQVKTLPMDVNLKTMYLAARQVDTLERLLDEKWV